MSALSTEEPVPPATPCVCGGVLHGPNWYLSPPAGSWLNRRKNRWTGTVVGKVMREVGGTRHQPGNIFRYHLVPSVQLVSGCGVAGRAWVV